MLLPMTLTAQYEDELEADSQPVENSVAGRDLALRLRAEMQTTEDDSELVDHDISYARFPTTMYDGEAGLFQASGVSFIWSRSIWQNQQDLDSDRWSVKLGLPLPAGWKLSLKHRFTDDAGSAPWDQYYAGLGKTLACGVYTYSQYRFSRSDGRTLGNQAYQYLSWKANNRIRISADGSCAWYEGPPDTTAWHGRLFTTVFLVEDRTSLRTEGMLYRHSGGTDYEEYKAYLYQKLWSSTLLRLGYRYYTDDEGFSSQALSIKARHYFSPGLSAHVGYRYYMPDEGPNLNTIFAGMGVIF